MSGPTLPVYCGWCDAVELVDYADIELTFHRTAWLSYLRPCCRRHVALPVSYPMAVRLAVANGRAVERRQAAIDEAVGEWAADLASTAYLAAEAERRHT